MTEGDPVSFLLGMLQQRRSMTTMTITKELLDELLSGVENANYLLGSQ